MSAIALGGLTIVGFTRGPAALGVLGVGALLGGGAFTIARDHLRGSVSARDRRLAIGQIVSFLVMAVAVVLAALAMIGHYVSHIFDCFDAGLGPTGQACEATRRAAEATSPLSDPAVVVTCVTAIVFGVAALLIGRARSGRS